MTYSLCLSPPMLHPVFTHCPTRLAQALRMTDRLARYLAGNYYPSVALTLKDMSTWTELIGHAQLRSFVDDDGLFWLEQNVAKNTEWGQARS